jgi:nitrogen regulatory protein PII
VDYERGLNKINPLKMLILNTKEEVKDKLKNNILQAAHLLRLKGYGSIKYTCACGEIHDVKDKDVSCKGSAKPFKALVKCKNNFMTMIKIEGFFKKKAISEYGFDASIMD